MGLSSKQVSGDGLDWGRNFLQVGALELPKPPQVRQQQQQQQEQQQLRCPRCDSINTKFSYYNNYNRSQPRHFCKSCKRHWTKGGTLRNVPVGGGRKNKRHKTPNNATAAAAATTTNTATNSHQGNNSDIAIQLHQQQQHLPLASLLPLSMQPNYINNENSSNNKFNRDSNNILGSAISLPPISNFPFTSLTSLNNNCSFLSSTFQFPNVYNYTGETEAIDNLTVTSTATTIVTPPWQMPSTSSFMDSSSHWSWEDLTAFISTDLKQIQDEFQ